MDKLSKKVDKKYRNKYYNDAYSQILEQNIRESHLYYEDLFFKKNLKNLLKYMEYYFKKNKIDFSILIVPTYYDLKLEKSRIKYISFYKSLNNSKIIDLTEDILKFKNWSNYYFKNKLGGHLNKSGNYFLADIINKKISK